MTKINEVTVEKIIVGDELGLIKKLEIQDSLNQIVSPKVICVNRDILEQPSPDKAVLTIRRFRDPYYLKFGSKNLDFSSETENLFLICSKTNRLQIYNSETEKFCDIIPHLNESKIAGSIPFRNNFIINCYQNGTIYSQNIEKEILQHHSNTNKKALKVLGLDGNNNKAFKNVEENNEFENDFNKKSKKIKVSKDDSKGIKKGKFNSINNIYNANLNTLNTSIDCFELEDNYLAIGGKNHSLKVFDIEKEQSIFTAKPTSPDWLGLTAPIYVSGISWLDKYPSNLIATTSRSEPIVRIYDIRADSKAIMSMNMKEKSTFHSNSPVFTTICSTRNIFNENSNNHQLILGSTVGRMIAIDLRLNSQTFKTVSSFKGFGGSIRDIKFIPETNLKSKIITCCLDRFVRVHNYETGFEKSKELKAKFYLKTKLTCLQPILKLKEEKKTE